MLSSGGSINYTINGTHYDYGAWFSIGDRSVSYYVIHLMYVSASSLKLFIAIQKESTFDPNTATWNELQLI